MATGFDRNRDQISELLYDFRVIKNIMVFRGLNWACSNARGSMLCQEWGLSFIIVIALGNYVVKA